MVELKPQSFRVIEGDGVAAGQDGLPNEHVGAFLREARETTGRSLADVAEYLHIRAKFLQSIENGRYEDLPGPTYAIGFIRSYADYLGLDTDTLMTQFKMESSGVEGHPDLEFPAPSTVGWFPTGKAVASCAVLAAAVFGGWFYLQTKNSVEVSAVPAPPGYNSAASLETASEKSVDVTIATTDVAADELAETVTLVDGVAGAINGETTSVDGAQSYLQPVPITALVAPDPLTTEADLQQPEPVETVRKAPPSAVIAAPAEIVEPSAQVENEPPPVSEGAAKSKSAPITQSKVAEPPSPVSAAPASQGAALPIIPADSGETDTNEDGRTFGAINQEARVIIGARADSWVQVLDSEQNVLLTRMLRPGDRYQVPDRNDLVMLTGNAGGLIISVDGETAPRIGSDGAILHNVRLDVELLKTGRAVIQ